MWQSATCGNQDEKGCNLIIYQVIVIGWLLTYHWSQGCRNRQHNEMPDTYNMYHDIRWQCFVTKDIHHWELYLKWNIWIFTADQIFGMLKLLIFVYQEECSCCKWVQCSLSPRLQHEKHTKVNVGRHVLLVMISILPTNRQDTLLGTNFNISW